MSIRKNYNELENRGFDAGGGEVLYYQGNAFTGIVVDTDETGVVITEQEFKDGHLEGVQREYYQNGQLREEYFITFNTTYGILRHWDKLGNLIEQIDFGPKP